MHILHVGPDIHPHLLATVDLTLHVHNGLDLEQILASKRVDLLYAAWKAKECSSCAVCTPVLVEIPSIYMLWIIA